MGGYGNSFINNFIPFFGYDFLSLTGNSFVKGSLVLDYELIKANPKIICGYSDITALNNAIYAQTGTDSRFPWDGKQ